MSSLEADARVLRQALYAVHLLLEVAHKALSLACVTAYSQQENHVAACVTEARDAVDVVDRLLIDRLRTGADGG